MSQNDLRNQVPIEKADDFVDQLGSLDINYAYRPCYSKWSKKFQSYSAVGTVWNAFLDFGNPLIPYSAAGR